MELGNMIFGHSRGEWAVPRDDSYFQPLRALSDALTERLGTSEWDRHWGGPAFENDTFAMRPYYWGDCACGYEEIRDAWHEANPHSDGCYQRELYDGHADRRRAYGINGSPMITTVEPIEINGVKVGILMSSMRGPGYREWRERYEMYRQEDKALRRRLCEKHDIPWNDGRGSAVHCTCDHDKRWEAFATTNDHAPTCPTVLPNFHHKPSDLRLSWYKYPLRDSYMSRKITVGEWRRICTECIASLSA